MTDLAEAEKVPDPIIDKGLKGGALGPFAYVMPALSKDGDHAAFYSDTFRPAGITRPKMGARRPELLR